MRKYYIFIIIVTLILIPVVATGFIVGGTPASLQEIALDTKRISDFETIKQAVDFYFKENNKLPVSTDKLNMQTKLVDPTTYKQYDYEIISNSSYKLCAEFSTDSNQTENMYPSSSIKKHNKGYDCVIYQVSNIGLPGIRQPGNF